MTAAESRDGSGVVPVGEAVTRAVALLGARPPLIVVSDFDGTLAPISTDPMGAAIEPVGRRAIRLLARIADVRPKRLVVVVLSGRTASDVATRIRVGGVRYLGNHGLEGGALARRARAEGLDVRVDAELERFIGPAAVLARGVAQRLGNPEWLFVELKGPSVAFHFRQAPNTDTAREELLRAIDAVERETGGTGLVGFEGRKIVELRPEGAGGKGHAVARLLDRHRPGAALVLGDDVSDAEAFRTIRAARGRGEIDALAIGINGANETPPAVTAAADLLLAMPRDAGRVLLALARAIERETVAGEPSRAGRGAR
ncbi:MAG TPA: trehalose-phosphatase [Candidatus Limnocylindrales bacterium]|nr:trehalose-phosphatase [Candidatus Limnocylindrales bacterium]